MAYQYSIASVELTPGAVGTGDPVVITVKINEVKLTWRQAAAMKWNQLKKYFWD